MDTTNSPFKCSPGLRRNECPNGLECEGHSRQVCSRHGRNVRLTCLFTTERPSTLNAFSQMAEREAVASLHPDVSHRGKEISFRSDGMCHVTDVPATCPLKHYWVSAPRDCVEYSTCIRADICPYGHEDGLKERMKAKTQTRQALQEHIRPCDENHLCKYMKSGMCKKVHYRTVQDRPMCLILHCDDMHCTFRHEDGRTFLGSQLAKKRGVGTRFDGGIVREKAPPPITGDDFPPLGKAKGKK